MNLHNAPAFNKREPQRIKNVTPIVWSAHTLLVGLRLEYFHGNKISA